MSHPADPLIVAWLTDGLDADSVQRLEGFLRDDPTARARFARFCQSEVVLPQAVDVAPVRASTTGIRRVPRVTRRLRMRRPDGRLNWVLPAAAAALVSVIVLLTVMGRPSPVTESPTIVAPMPHDAVPSPAGPLELLRADGEVRLAGKSMTSGMQVPRGAVVEVLGGTAELRWRSDGSLLTLAAGSALRVDGATANVHLQEGRLEARIVRRTEAPFIVSAPHATALVMGTTFTLQVADGVTGLQVGAGRVRFTAVADRTAMEVIANESARADANGMRLPDGRHVLGFVPTARDITRELGGRMIRRGTLRLADLRDGGLNLRIDCSDEVRSVHADMRGIDKRLEQVLAFHVFGDVKDRSTTVWQPRVGTFHIDVQPCADHDGRQPLGPVVGFELTIVP